MGIHIGPRILGLTLLQQHVGHDLVKLGNHLEHGVIRQVLQCKLALAGVTWVSLSQDGVAIAWHHLQPRKREEVLQYLNCAKIPLLVIVW